MSRLRFVQSPRLDRLLIQLFALLPFAINAPILANTGLYADIEISSGGQPLGTVTAELYHAEVPRVVANFVGLATGQRPWIDPTTNLLRTGVPYYDGLQFHRLIANFVIQGGDPTGTGSSGPGYVFQDQFHPDLQHDGPYYLSMAHAGAHTNGSQFFITLQATPHLDFLHSVFGKVISGREIIDGFTDPSRFPVDSAERPFAPLVMETVRIHGDALNSFDVHDPSHGLPTFQTVDVTISTALSETQQPQHFLRWHRKPLVDYPVFASPNLQDWFLLGYGISMNEDADFSIQVSGVLGPDGDPDREFYYLTAIDYNLTPRIPRTILRAGVILRLDVDGGVLELRFSGTPASPGEWTYTRDGTTSEGEMTEASENLSEVIPDEGYFIAPSPGSYARHLLVRQVTVFLDQPVGPNGLTAVQPTLSFHAADSGWYDGRYNSDPQAVFRFRDRFTVIWP